MKAFKKWAWAVAAVAAFGAGSAGASTIDLFTDPLDQSHRVTDVTTGDGGVFQEYGSAMTTSILGGYRDMYVEAISKTGVSQPRTDMYAGSGILAFSNDSGTVGYGVVQWDGQDNSGVLDIDGLGGADLIDQEGCPALGCDRFVASVLQADAGFEYKITVYDMAGNWSILTSDTLFPVGGDGVTADYLFDWFNLASGDYFLGGLPFNIMNSGGMVDFSNIGALQFEINTSGVINIDLQLASITKTGIPEPGALALAGLGLFAASVASRRRKNRAA